MEKFTDSQGDRWTFEVTVANRKPVLRDADFDLYSVVEPAELQRLEDPEMMVSVLGSLCEGQIAKRGLTAEQFSARFTGDVIADAFAALSRAVTAFFPVRPATKPAADEKSSSAESSRKSQGAVDVANLITDLAGVLRVDPGPLTLRELARMVEAHQRDEWGRWSSLMALIYNVNATGKGKGKSPSDFNPYTAKSMAKATAIQMALKDLRGVFFPGRTTSPGDLVGGGKTPIQPAQFIRKV